MSKTIRVDSEAEEELLAAVAWYEGRRPGLGAEFLGSVNQTLARIQERPAIGSLFPYLPNDLGVRHLLVRRFPYGVAYIELLDEIRVLAFAHSKRKPGYWRNR